MFLFQLFPAVVQKNRDTTIYVHTYLMIICPVSASSPDIQESTRGLRLIKESSPVPRFKVFGQSIGSCMAHGTRTEGLRVMVVA